MVYLYITSYASTNPELSLLAINTLQKDCRDEDPMTRGLALRSFTALRLDNITEYLPPVVAAGTGDVRLCCNIWEHQGGAFGCRLLAGHSGPHALQDLPSRRHARLRAAQTTKEGPVDRVAHSCR